MGSRSRDKGGGGSAGGPVAELSLPRFAILTAVSAPTPPPLCTTLYVDLPQLGLASLDAGDTPAPP